MFFYLKIIVYPKNRYKYHNKVLKQQQKVLTKGLADDTGRSNDIIIASFCRASQRVINTNDKSRA